jgi:hypothetical protein
MSTTAIGRGREPTKTTSILHLEGAWPESVLEDDISKYPLPTLTFSPNQDDLIFSYLQGATSTQAYGGI